MVQAAFRKGGFDWKFEVSLHHWFGHFSKPYCSAILSAMNAKSAHNKTLLSHDLIMDEKTCISKTRMHEGSG